MLTPLPGFPGRSGPVVLCILDGVGLGRHDAGDAVFHAAMPTLRGLVDRCPHRSLRAHGAAVGLPSEDDMGNSEVGHNALGAGRVYEQGASLVDAALASGSAFGETWRWLTQTGTLHLIGLLSDGNVHSNVRHLHLLLRQAAAEAVLKVRVHVLTDGRDVDERSAMRFIAPLEALLAELSVDGRDYKIASGGGRMWITMDRYDADWPMVQRGWDCHVRGEGRPFRTAPEAIGALYAEDPRRTDQWLPAFVITDATGAPVGPVREGDGVLFFNFRGDRAIQISRAFEGRPCPVQRDAALAIRYAGMMQYDGDERLPARYLVEPPAIEGTVGEHLVAAGLRTFAVSETQKFGHVTYFFNGNRSGLLDSTLERYVCVPSTHRPFDEAPEMSAAGITDAALGALAEGVFDHVRLNYANGDMVGHTGDLQATIRAMEVVDAELARLAAGVEAAGGVLLVTADHGNADQMFQLDKKTGAPTLDAQGQPVPRTAHSLNPVPFVLVDPAQRWALTELPDAGLANVGATLLTLLGLTPPPEYLPSLVAPARSPR
ncbi:MAG: 2,3-bisphosphoglycerate-independent phosphoglycerate mutase [Pseudomonadota bacterium]